MQTRVSVTEWEEWRRATGRNLKEFQSIKRADYLLNARGERGTV